MWLAALALAVVVLAWPVPRLLPEVRALRRVPGAGLLLWQAVSLAAVVGGLALAPLAILQTVRRGDAVPAPADNVGMLLLGLSVSGLLAARLLVRGHRVGTQLRRTRREHRVMVDLLAAPHDTAGSCDRSVRVLSHPTPTAYCVPGVRRRVVLSDSTIATLAPAELDGVLAHERAHLRLRHDLVLEFFTVLHTAVPQVWRSPHGLTEVTLLIELLADRRAVRAVGDVAVARALVALASGDHPDAALGYDGGGPLIRLGRLHDRRPHRILATVVVVAAAVVSLLPVLLGALVVFAA